MNVEMRLRELGLELPEVPKPVAEYVPAKRVGDLVYVSGQGPIHNVRNTGVDISEALGHSHRLNTRRKDAREYAELTK